MREKYTPSREESRNRPRKGLERPVLGSPRYIDPNWSVGRKGEEPNMVRAIKSLGDTINDIATAIDNEERKENPSPKLLEELERNFYNLQEKEQQKVQEFFSLICPEEDLPKKFDIVDFKNFLRARRAKEEMEDAKQRYERTMRDFEGRINSKNEGKEWNPPTPEYRRNNHYQSDHYQKGDDLY